MESPVGPAEHGLGPSWWAGLHIISPEWTQCMPLRCPDPLRLHHVSTLLGSSLILFQSAPPSPSFSVSSSAASQLLRAHPRPWEAPSIVHLHAQNSQCTFRHGAPRRPEQQKSPDTPPQTSDLDRHSHLKLASSHALPVNRPWCRIRVLQALRTPFPGFPSRSPSLQTLPLEDSRCHSPWSSAYGFCLILSAEKPLLANCSHVGPSGLPKCTALPPRNSLGSHQVPLLSNESALRS